MPDQLTLRIVLERPPAGVDFALQEGRGSDYQPIQRQRSNGADIVFQFSVGVKPGKTSGSVTLTGPLVQGPADERFVYIDIGTYAGQADSCWSRRLKVPLRGMTAEMVELGAVLEARVPGTGRDGGPSCASVKAFPGWMPVK